MSYTYRFHLQAIEEFNEAYAWYENRTPGLGDRCNKAVRHKLNIISVQPELFGSRNNKLFREANVDFFPYLIIYRIKRKWAKFLLAQYITSGETPAKNTGGTIKTGYYTLPPGGNTTATKVFFLFIVQWA